jgi:hypothetical protein
MTKIGYARVSTLSQSADIQVEALAQRKYQVVHVKVVTSWRLFWIFYVKVMLFACIN